MVEMLLFRETRQSQPPHASLFRASGESGGPKQCECSQLCRPSAAISWYAAATGKGKCGPISWLCRERAFFRGFFSRAFSPKTAVLSYLFCPAPARPVSLCPSGTGFAYASSPSTARPGFPYIYECCRKRVILAVRGPSLPSPSLMRAFALE